MNKKEIISALAATTELTKGTCATVFDALVDVITVGLTKGDVVSLPNLGKFSVVERAARTGTNPQTGEEIEIPASHAVKFKVSGVLKDIVKNNL